jgi:Polysaccharide deacetylase
MRAAVLTYHSQNINGRDRNFNDHLALEDDLRLIERLNIPVVSLHAIVDALVGRIGPGMVDGAVAVCCDDGTVFDWYDMEHAAHGPQRSFANLLAAHAARRGGSCVPQLTSFVIASPLARGEIDAGCYNGNAYSNDAWWAEAAATERVAIENHSWDHAHACVTEICQREQRKGSFLGIETWVEADAEIRRAADFIDQRIPPRRTTLFAYPYGEVSDYLAEEYLPRFRHQHRVAAAFTTEPQIVTSGQDLWRLPRFVCGSHWHSTHELEQLLKPLKER